jgi:choline dehydrogenase-like flavoprotein
MDTYDFVIVRSGTAGSVLAYRLGEDPAARILMLEAGDDDLPEEVESTFRWNELLLTKIDWAYNGAPQPGLADHQVYSAAGKGVGGTSNIFHIMHVRARPGGRLHQGDGVGLHRGQRQAGGDHARSRS